MPAYPQFRRVIDVMKKMKDAVTSQLTTAEKITLITCLKTANCNYIGFSVPLASNAEFLAAGTTPSPRTIEAEWLDWATVIHDAGLGIEFRPCFPGMEGIWNFEQKVGGNRYPAGSYNQAIGAVFSDTFQRTSVGSSYTTAADGGSGNIWSIVGDELMGPASDGWRRSCLTTQSYKDFTAVAKVKKVGHQQLIGRATTDSNFPGYGFQLRDSGEFRLERPGLAQLATVTKTPFVEGAYYWIKMQCSGTTISGKVWADGAAEPGSWDISITDSTFSEGLIGFSGESNFGIFDNLTITPVADTANWCGKELDFILANPDCFSDIGPYPDIWAPAPERTEGIFSDSTAFLPNTGAGVQQNYVDFFNELHRTAQAAFQQIGKPDIIVGDTSNNYSEARSGWLLPAFFANAGRVCVDYYLNYNDDGFSPSQATADIITIYNLYAQKRVAWQEYGPIETFGESMPDRVVAIRALLNQIYDDLVIPGVLEEFNLWGGWEEQNTSIVNKTGSGSGSAYSLNELGTELQSFFNRVATAQAATVWKKVGRSTLNNWAKVVRH
jgi:hypothetical protein